MANLIRGDRFRWPQGRVPYLIDAGDFPEGTARRYKIEWAIDHWNSRSRVRSRCARTHPNDSRHQVGIIRRTA